MSWSSITSKVSGWFTTAQTAAQIAAQAQQTVNAQKASASLPDLSAKLSQAQADLTTAQKAYNDILAQVQAAEAASKG